MSDLLPVLITGMATGSVFALAGMGLVLTYKTSGIFNFAHGVQAALGAYVMWDLWENRGWPWPVAVGASLAIAGVGAGLLLERMGYLLANKPPASRIVATIGCLVATQALLVIHYGAATIPMRYFLPTDTVRLGGVFVRYEQIIVFGLGLASVVLLDRFFRTARLGIAMQGVVDDPALLSLQGVSPVRARRGAWIIGSCFAAASGAFLAPSLGLDAALLTLLIVQAFGAAAIGRFDSLPLTYAGGLVVGVGQELLKYLAAQEFLSTRISAQLLQTLPSNLPFLVLFVILLATRRSKLLERGTRVLVAERPVPPWSRRAGASVLTAVAVLAVALPALVSTRLPTYTAAAAFAAIFASLHQLVRVSGQVSVCHMSFAAVGAATYAHAMHAGIPFLVSLLIAGLVAVPFGAFVALPAIRLPNVYLAIATFGFAILVERVLLPLSWLLGPDLIVPASRPSFAMGDRAYYFMVVAVVAGCFAVTEVVRRTRLGRLLKGLADAPEVIVAHGVSTHTVRALAFCTSAFLAGVAGALIGPITGSVTVGTFSFGVSLTLLAVLFVAGRRPLVGPLVAAAAYLVVPAYVDSADAASWLQVVFGAAAIAVASGVPAMVREAWTAAPRLRARDGRVSPARARVRPVEGAVGL